MACTYRNSSDRMVIARCLGADAFFLERVVFPFELLSFECPSEAELQIWSHGLGGAELIETIDVRSLAIEGAGGSVRLECVASSSEDDRSAPWAAAG